MRKRFSYIFAICAVLLLLLVGCKVRRLPQSIGNGAEGVAQLTQRFAQFQQDSLKSEPFRMAGSISFYNAMKGDRLSSAVVLFASPREGLSLMLRPLPFVEAGTLYLSPSAVVVVDKINKQYVATDFQSLAERAGVELSYSLLEGLLLGQYPFRGVVTQVKVDESRVYERNAKLQIEVCYQMHDFLSHPSSLEITSLGDKKGKLVVAYPAYQQTPMGLLPEEVGIKVESEGKLLAELSFSFKTPRTEEQIFQRLTPPSLEGYRAIPLQSFANPH